MGPSEDTVGGRGTIYLTLDVEPDYGRAGTFQILEKTEPFFAWVKEARIPLTAFVVGRLLEQGHRVIDSLQEAGVPIALHGFSHAPQLFGTMHTDHREEITRAADAYVRRTGRRPAGYRAPSGIVSREDLQHLDGLGFRYDSSIFPTRRPGRYDFSGLPRSPFRWEGTKLAEIPFGLMTSRIPAGMTFVNLVGLPISAHLLGRAARRESMCVLDMHFHNLFMHCQALAALPWALRGIYIAGALRSGFTRLTKLVARLRDSGVSFGNLEADVLRLKPDSLPVVGWECFDKDHGPSGAS